MRLIICRAWIKYIETALWWLISMVWMNNQEGTRIICRVGVFVVLTRENVCVLCKRLRFTSFTQHAIMQPIRFGWVLISLHSQSTHSWEQCNRLIHVFFQLNSLHNSLLCVYCINHLIQYTLRFNKTWYFTIIWLIFNFCNFSTEKIQTASLQPIMSPLHGDSYLADPLLKLV